jgi:cytochrome c oxidase subunit 3
MSAKQHHEYHLVDPSPWPLLASIGFLTLTGGSAFAFHKTPYAAVAAVGGLLLLLYVGYRWWSDVVKEAAVDKAHTSPVQRGLRYGMAFFIISEVMFFFAFFFSFFAHAILPMDILEGAWPVAEGAFPPTNIHTLDPWSLPLFNTLLLLLSGTTVTWAHAALLNNDRKNLIRGLICTIILGLTFTCVQAYEYTHALHAFGFKSGAYASNFYMATGFHGAHVIIGTIFLIVCLVRATKNQFSEKNHLGFEFAAWYWHFVDVVWLFLFTFVYVWAR